MAADPVRAPFDLKVAIGCFLLAGVWNRKVLAYCFLSLAAGFLIVIVGTLAKSVWRVRRGRD